MSLVVDDPEIAEVLDLETGECISVTDVVGAELDAVIHLRMGVKTGIKSETPKYACAMCGVPVYLVMRADTRRFFFRHLLEDGRCSAQTRGELSQKEIDARKYDGAKESQLHLRMKEWVAQCLRADARFSDVKIEERWKGALTGEWRRPDVRATLNGMPIAFEIQLSTTHLDVIAERRLFYLREGGLLLWIFAKFDADNRRLTQDDVFYNNNQNAFVVSEKTVKASLDAGEFKLGCIWAEPTSATEASGLYRKLVSFHELTLDATNQRAFYFDFYGARDALARAYAEKLASARDNFEAFWLNQALDESQGHDEWQKLRSQFRAIGLKLPTYPRELPGPLLNSLYSAKHGRPVGWRYKKLVEVAHLMATTRHQGCTQPFLKAVTAFNRGAQLEREDKSGKWRETVAIAEAAIAAGVASYAPDLGYEGVVAFLIPEVWV